MDLEKRIILSKPILSFEDIKKFIQIKDDIELLEYLLLLNDNCILPIYIRDIDNLQPSDYSDDYWEDKEEFNLWDKCMEDYMQNRYLEDINTKELLSYKDIPKYSVRPYKSRIHYGNHSLIIDEVIFENKIYIPTLLHYNDKSIRLYGKDYDGKLTFPSIDTPEQFLIVKTTDFIEHFSNILDLEPYINEKYKPYSKEELKEIVNRNIYLDYFDICNLIGKNIGYSYTYTNHNHEITEINTSDTFNLILSKHNSSYTNISISLNESRINFIPYKDSKPIYIYDWDNLKGKYKFKNSFSFGFELFRKNINFDDSLNHQPKPAINQDDSYEYSKALKPYNDIILAFDSEYQRLSNDNIRIQSTNHIQPWLKENYKNLKDHDIRVLNNLIQIHYKLKK
ncbi:predicted protein [Francisella tularensis subsp. novicida GA99-3548]|nr:hypothetical protein AQ14_851 [Francisella tularensis subsp. novicida D9876]EDN38532.1 predicted protein [Francisella tularensis subsp. novicida GA99-3548]